MPSFTVGLEGNIISALGIKNDSAPPSGANVYAQRNFYVTVQYVKAIPPAIPNDATQITFWANYTPGSTPSGAAAPAGNVQGTTGVITGVFPAYVRILRQGTNLIGQWSKDNIDWTTIATFAAPWDMLDGVSAGGQLFTRAWGSLYNPPTNNNRQFFNINFIRIGEPEPLQPSYVSRGTQGDNSATRWTKYSKDDVIQNLINNAVDIENGIDFTIDPITRQMNTKPGSLQTVDSRKKPGVVFGYNWGPRNIQKFDRENDFSVVRNRFTAKGKYGTGLQESAASEDAYNIVMEETAQLSEVVDNNVLVTFAAGEVALRDTPRKIYSFIPFAWTQDSSVPEPFVDYTVGDQISLFAKHGERIKIEGLPVRIFGINIDISDDGTERVSSLQVSP